MSLFRCLMAAVAVCTLCGKAVAENLLNNPELKPGVEGGPYDWNLTYEDVRDNFEMVKDEGRNVVRFHVRGKYCSIRQSDIRLKEGSRVRIGAWVRTKDVESRGRIVLYNWLWNGDAGTAAYPRDTNGKWVKHEAEITVPPSIDGHYTFAF